MPLTELPLEFTKASQGGSDELSVLVLDVLQDVLPVQADGVRDEQRAVQISQQPRIQEHSICGSRKVYFI